jgi:hypothetical protein
MPAELEEAVLEEPVFEEAVLEPVLANETALDSAFVNAVAMEGPLIEPPVEVPPWLILVVGSSSFESRDESHRPVDRFQSLRRPRPRHRD